MLVSDLWQVHRSVFCPPLLAGQQPLAAHGGFPWLLRWQPEGSLAALCQLGGRRGRRVCIIRATAPRGSRVLIQDSELEVAGTAGHHRALAGMLYSPETG